MQNNIKVMIGGGKLTERILISAKHNNLLSLNEVYILEEDKSRAEELQTTYGVKCSSLLNPIAHAQAIVFTSRIKPAEKFIEQVSKLVRDGIPIVSLAEGWTIAELEKDFPNHPVIRAANNHLAIYGEGLGMFAVGSVAKADARAVAFTIMSMTGKAIEVSEELLESFTKFIDDKIEIFMEQLKKFIIDCKELGLSDEQAQIAAGQMLVGMKKHLEMIN